MRIFALLRCSHFLTKNNSVFVILTFQILAKFDLTDVVNFKQLAQISTVVSPIFEHHHEKTNALVSDLVRHKPGCTATEDGLRLEILDLERRGIVLSM